MRKVNAIIERASDGNYSIYMDADDMSYLVTGTGKTEAEAIGVFLKGYEDTKAYYAEQNKPFEEVVFEFIRDDVNNASYHKCCECGKQAYAWFPVFDPDIPAYPYCRECLDKAKNELFIKLCEVDEKLKKFKRP